MESRGNFLRLHTRVAFLDKGVKLREFAWEKLLMLPVAHNRTSTTKKGLHHTLLDKRTWSLSFSRHYQNESSFATAASEHLFLHRHWTQDLGNR